MLVLFTNKYYIGHNVIYIYIYIYIYIHISTKQTIKCVCKHIYNIQ